MEFTVCVRASSYEFECMKSYIRWDSLIHALAECVVDSFCFHSRYFDFDVFKSSICWVCNTNFLWIINIIQYVCFVCSFRSPSLFFAYVALHTLSMTREKPNHRVRVCVCMSTITGAFNDDSGHAKHDNSVYSSSLLSFCVIFNFERKWDEVDWREDGGGRECGGDGNVIATNAGSQNQRRKKFN